MTVRVAAAATRAEGEAMGRTRTKTTTTTRTARRASDAVAPATTMKSVAPLARVGLVARVTPTGPRPDVRAVLDRSSAVAFAEMRPGARRAAHASVVPFICG